MDEASQWQVQAGVQGIGEAFLLPVLALIIAQFPFEIAGLHSDNGSEYINARVARILNKLNIEQTKSRSRQSNANALAESKNASAGPLCSFERKDQSSRDHVQNSCPISSTGARKLRTLMA